MTVLAHTLGLTWHGNQLRKINELNKSFMRLSKKIYAEGKPTSIMTKYSW